MLKLHVIEWLHFTQKNKIANDKIQKHFRQYSPLYTNTIIIHPLALSVSLTHTLISLLSLSISVSDITALEIVHLLFSDITFQIEFCLLQCSDCASKSGIYIFSPYFAPSEQEHLKIHIAWDQICNLIQCCFSSISLIPY